MIKALIIDDEPLAHKVIANYAKDIPYLQIAANAYDALEAHQLLQKQPIDMLFLDIHLPKIKGLQFLKTLRQPPIVIVTSAYEHYALEGYELDVCDYLLKPFSFERFLKAVNKTSTRLPQLSNVQTPPIPPSSNAQFFVKVGKAQRQISYQDIRYIEAYGAYAKIHLEKEMILASERLAFLEQNLPKDLFMRIHKSYIIAKTHIKLIEAHQLSIQNVHIPIGNSYRQQFKAWVYN